MASTRMPYSTTFSTTPCGSMRNFFLYGYGDPRDLHSFPTRRSSDLDDPHHDEVQVVDFAGDARYRSRQVPLIRRFRGPGQREDRSASSFDHPVRHHVLVGSGRTSRSEEHTSELQSQSNLVCRLLLEK